MRPKKRIALDQLPLLSKRFGVYSKKFGLNRRHELVGAGRRRFAAEFTSSLLRSEPVLARVIAGHNFPAGPSKSVAKEAAIKMRKRLISDGKAKSPADANKIILARVESLEGKMQRIYRLFQKQRYRLPETVRGFGNAHHQSLGVMEGIAKTIDLLKVEAGGASMAQSGSLADRMHRGIERRRIRHLKRLFSSEYYIRAFIRNAARLPRVDSSKLPRNRRVRILTLCVEGLEASPFLKNFYNQILSREHLDDRFDINSGGAHVMPVDSLNRAMLESDFVVFTSPEIYADEVTRRLADHAEQNGVKVFVVSPAERPFRANRRETSLLSFMYGAMDVFKEIAGQINSGKLPERRA